MRTDKEIIEGALSEFEQIAAVPHKSGHTEKIADFFVSWARSHGFAARKDAVGNVIIDVPAKDRPETAPLTVLQTHRDMVCVAAEGKRFDPLTDPVVTVADGDWLRADGTSLGADDGMGSAIIMDILTSDAPHGPVRFIATVDEETSMKGAENLDAKYIKGAKNLINVDSEESDTVIVSSAGSFSCDAVCRLAVTAPEKASAVRIAVNGLKGGHSGMMIHEGRLNAVRAIAAVLKDAKESGVPFELASLKGGKAKNAIPADAEAVITLDAADVARLEESAAACKTRFADEYKSVEDGISVTVKAAPAPASAIKDPAPLLDFILESFDGVYSMSEEIEGLVKSSSNLGTADVAEGLASFGFMIRSSETKEFDVLKKRLSDLAADKGFSIENARGSSAWEYKKDNALLAAVLSAYKELNGRDMKATAIHAGLETGIFAALSPDTDIVSIGPDVLEPHSPKERCFLPSIAITSRLIAAVLAK